MIILKVTISLCNTVQFDLPHPKLVIDPRPNVELKNVRFECIYHNNGKIATIKMNTWYVHYSPVEVTFRAYDPAIEPVPDFNSTTYTYFGCDGEYAPIDTIVVIVHPSVNTIKRHAFSDCQNLQKCLMHDGVHEIEKFAFEACPALRVVRLSQSLRWIGLRAFGNCTSLEVLFLFQTPSKRLSNLRSKAAKALGSYLYSMT